MIKLIIYPLTCDMNTNKDTVDIIEPENKRKIHEFLNTDWTLSPFKIDFVKWVILTTVWKSLAL